MISPTIDVHLWLAFEFRCQYNQVYQRPLLTGSPTGSRALSGGRPLVELGVKVLMHVPATIIDLNEQAPHTNLRARRACPN